MVQTDKDNLYKHESATLSVYPQIIEYLDVLRWD